MSAVIEAGFVFWGLFVVFAAIVIGYVAWMVAAERRHRDRSDADGPEPRRPEPRRPEVGGAP